MAILTPGNPVSIGSPLTFSGAGGTNTSGGAFTALSSFETAIGGSKNTAPAPQTNGFRTIVWDAVKLDGTDFGGGANTTVIHLDKTVGIPLNRFQTQGVFFEEVYAVSGDGFTDVNPNAAGLFPAFSPKNTFAMFNENTISQSFILPGPNGTTPALAGVRGFGAIFINNEVANTSSIEYFHGAQSLGKFFVPVGGQSDPEFLGVLFNDPIVTSVTLTLGTDTFFFFNGTIARGNSMNDPPTHNLVVTDDFVYPEPVSILDASPILPGPNGTLNATPRAAATVGTTFTGSVATFSDSDPSAKASQFTATINWGDGRISNGAVQANAQGGFDVIGTNTYTTARLFPTSVHIQDFDGAPELDVASVIQVSAVSTTTSLSVSSSPAIAGQPVTLTAQVTPSAGNLTNNGFVLFQDNGLPLAVAPVDSTGAASFTTQSLSLGAHSLTAAFLGTGDFTASNSAPVPLAVNANVTSQFAITLGSIRRSGRRWVQHIILMNNGAALFGPLFFVLDNLSKRVKLLNASGFTRNVPPLGSPFLFVNLGPSNQIGSGASVGTDLIFSARTSRSIRYIPRILVGLSQP
jgi:hypothetical protein